MVAKTFRGHARILVTGDGRKNPSTAAKEWYDRTIVGKRKKVGKSKKRK